MSNRHRDVMNLCARRCGWSTPYSGRLTPTKDTWCPLKRRFGVRICAEGDSKLETPSQQLLSFSFGKGNTTKSGIVCSNRNPHRNATFYRNSYEVVRRAEEAKMLRERAQNNASCIYCLFSSLFYIKY